ncbi:MAG: MATE family efflux transporter [Flavobacteriales bacterium]|nr:MATE family efflux transporter [Flavobacteriales bacterium]
MSIRAKLLLIKDAIIGGHQDYTALSIRRALLLLAIPMILEMVLEAVFAIVDVYFVSRLGTDEVAAVGFTESIVMLVYSIAIGIAMATSAMVARRVGEKDTEGAALAAAQALYIGIGVSFAISLVGIFFSPELLGLMGASESVVAVGTPYMRWLLGGNLVIMLLFLINAIFRGAGDAQISLRVLTLANGLNIILDPLLIFGIGPFPELGLEGAAIATTTGRGIGVLLQLYLLFGGKSVVKVSLKHMKVQWNIIRKLLDVSIGGTGQFLISTASWIFLMRIMSEFGTDAVAGYILAIRIIIFTILPAWGLSSAAATMVGQNLGAKSPERAEQAVWKAGKYNVIFLGLISIVFYFFPEPIVRIFPVEDTIVEYAVLCLQIICFGYMAFAYGMVIGQAFNGAGDTRTPSVVNFVAFWLVQIPLAYSLAITLDYGPAGVFVAIAISQSLLAVINIMIFRRGKWKETAI